MSGQRVCWHATAADVEEMHVGLQLVREPEELVQCFAPADAAESVGFHLGVRNRSVIRHDRHALRQAATLRQMPQKLEDCRGLGWLLGQRVQ